MERKVIWLIVARLLTAGLLYAAALLLAGCAVERLRVEDPWGGVLLLENGQALLGQEQ